MTLKYQVYFAGLQNLHCSRPSSLFADSKRFSSEAHATIEPEEPSVINDTEKVVGDADKHEFQAETAELLNIVAKSLYSENEVSIFLIIVL